MSVPLNELADKFAEHIENIYPSFYGETLDHVKQAGAHLQRLATGLAPAVEGGLTIADQSLQRIADLYVENNFVPRKPLAQIFGECLLEDAPRVKREGIAFLAEEMRISPDTLWHDVRAAGKAISIPLHELADKFAEHICSDPNNALLFKMDEVKQAGVQLQRLAAALSPFIEGGLVITDHSLQQAAELFYADPLLALPDNSAVRNRAFVKLLLEQSAALKADDIAQLAHDVEALADTIQQVAGTPGLPETEAGARSRSWASREEQGWTSAGLNC